MDSSIAGKGFLPTVEDLANTRPDFVPNEGSLDYKVDFIQGRRDIVLPQATDKHWMQHTGYKFVEPIDPRHKEIDPIAVGVDLGLAKADLADTHIIPTATKDDLATIKVNLVDASFDLVRTKVDRIAKQTEFAAAKVVVIATKVSPILVTIFLVAANISLTIVKVSLTSTKVVPFAARVDGKFLGLYLEGIDNS